MSRRSTTTPSRPTAAAASTIAEPDLDRALDLVMEMMAIAGPSCRETEVVRFITAKLREAGVSDAAIQTDNAHRRTPLGGEVGNLLLKLKGKRRGPRRLLMAHMDTVPICVGSRPVLKDGLVRSADPKTGLGADDRAGAAVVLSTALELLEHKPPHPPRFAKKQVDQL